MIVSGGSFSRTCGGTTTFHAPVSVRNASGRVEPEDARGISHAVLARVSTILRQNRADRGRADPQGARPRAPASAVARASPDSKSNRTGGSQRRRHGSQPNSRRGRTRRRVRPSGEGATALWHCGSRCPSLFTRWTHSGRWRPKGPPSPRVALERATCGGTRFLSARASPYTKRAFPGRT